MTTTSEHGMLSESDSQQLAYAASVDRCLLTHNRVDDDRQFIPKISLKCDRIQ